MLSILSRVQFIPRYTFLCGISFSTEVEGIMKTKLEQEFGAKNIQIIDNSGGCGHMFEIHVNSSKFEGISKVKQHRIVQKVLQTEISQIHGLTLLTSSSDS